MGGPSERKNFPPQQSNDFTKKERERIAKLLRQPLRANLVKKRPAYGGKSAYYLDGGTSYSLANDIFGFDGWKSQIINTQIDYAKEKQKHSDRWYIGVSVIVRVELKNGTYHEDLGFGEAVNIKGRGAALQKAKKEAVTDATKRALRVFGNGLGNCLRLDWYLDALKKGNSFKDLQEEEYRQYDLLDPQTGGRALKRKEPESPCREARLSSVAPAGKSKLVVAPADLEITTTPIEEKEELTCPFTQSFRDLKQQPPLKLEDIAPPADVAIADGLKRKRDENYCNENQAPNKFMKRRFRVGASSSNRVSD